MYRVQRHMVRSAHGLLEGEPPPFAPVLTAFHPISGTHPAKERIAVALGWIVSPEGDVMAQTDPESPFATTEIDLDFARRSKQSYPRYVPE